MSGEVVRRGTRMGRLWRKVAADPPPVACPVPSGEIRYCPSCGFPLPTHFPRLEEDGERSQPCPDWARPPTEGPGDLCISEATAIRLLKRRYGWAQIDPCQLVRGPR